MARGLPDYGQNTQQYAIAGMGDLGEAVARLDSINVFDRRGFTIWQDDFESPVIRWSQWNGNGGLAPIVSSAYFYSGVQSALLQCGAQVDSYSQLSRNFSLIRRGKIGAEIWVQRQIINPAFFSLVVRLLDGTNFTRADLRYYPTNGTIWIDTPLGLVQVATAITMYNATQYFLPIKLVVDMDTDRYTRLIVGPQEIDLSAHELVQVGATALKTVIVYLSLYGVVGGATSLYLDNFILTQNEP